MVAPFDPDRDIMDFLLPSFAFGQSDVTSGSPASPRDVGPSKPEALVLPESPFQ